MQMIEMEGEVERGWYRGSRCSVSQVKEIDDCGEATYVA